MKAILAMLAAVALIGAASAWELTESTSYEHIVDGQGIDFDLGDWMGTNTAAESGTYFTGVQDPEGHELAAGVNNRFDWRVDHITEPWADAPAGYNAVNDDNTDYEIEATLVQAGGALVTTRPLSTCPDCKDPVAEAVVGTYQSLELCGAKFAGDYGTGNGPGMWAQFESEANAGIDDEAVVTMYANLEDVTPQRGQPGMIETDDEDGPDDTYFTRGLISMGASAGFELADYDSEPVFFGDVTSYAGFWGGHGNGIIEANAGGFENHVMVHNDGIWTGGWEEPTYWTDVTPNAGDGEFPWW